MHATQMVLGVHATHMVLANDCVLCRAVQAQGRAKLGVEAFAEALLGFVKILAENSGWVLGWT